MAATLLIPPFRALDASGNPYSGAKLYFYASPGTTTPVDVYTTAALSVAHANPVVADAGGKFANIYGSSAVAYRAVMKDSTDAVTLHDFDPINAGSSSMVSSIDVSGGTTGLSFSGGPVTSTGTITAAGTLAVANGGTGSTTASGARSSLGAAASGANTDITALDQDVTITATGTIASTSIGFRGMPLSGQTQGSIITLALSDAGKRVANTTGGWTIPANASVAFPTDTVIVLHNNSTLTQTVAITTDTLTLTGSTTTGTRTIAANGLATIVKVGTTSWLISGNVT